VRTTRGWLRIQFHEREAVEQALGSAWFYIQPIWLYLDTRTLGNHSATSDFDTFKPLQSIFQGGWNCRRVPITSKDTAPFAHQSLQSVSRNADAHYGAGEMVDGQMHPKRRSPASRRFVFTR